MLHPSYKLEYFRRQGWAPKWIAEAQRLITRIWESQYKQQPFASPPSRGAPPSVAAEPTPKKSKYFTSFADSHSASGVGESDELVAWLSGPTIPKVGDCIKWWSGQQLASSDSALPRMALDFLSAPATSVAVERAFSHGSLTVTARRHNLSDESVRSNVVLNSWFSQEHLGLVPEGEAVEMFRNKKSRLGRVIDVDTSS